MKKAGFIIIGSIIGGLFCIALAWLIGASFGPLYQSEDESARNFLIFMGCFAVSIIAGGSTGFLIAKR